NSRTGGFLRLAVREHAGQLDNLGEPAAVVLPFELNLKRNHAVRPPELRVYDVWPVALPDGICRTITVSGREERMRANGRAGMGLSAIPSAMSPGGHAAQSRRQRPPPRPRQGPRATHSLAEP